MNATDTASNIKSSLLVAARKSRWLCRHLEKMVPKSAWSFSSYLALAWSHCNKMCKIFNFFCKLLPAEIQFWLLLLLSNRQQENKKYMHVVKWSFTTWHPTCSGATWLQPQVCWLFSSGQAGSLMSLLDFVSCLFLCHGDETVLMMIDIASSTHVLVFIPRLSSLLGWKRGGLHWQLVCLKFWQSRKRTTPCSCTLYCDWSLLWLPRGTCNNWMLDPCAPVQQKSEFGILI
jgi:hypothetical protein